MDELPGNLYCNKHVSALEDKRQRGSSLSLGDKDVLEKRVISRDLHDYI